MLLAWKSVGAMTFAALEFLILIPLPGSEDHMVLSGKGAPWMGI
jgi:hypothetical protein